MNTKDLKFILSKGKFPVIVFLLFFLSTKLFAYKVIEDVATKAGGYEIPIKVCIPDDVTARRPVMFFVHGGGWNGGNETEVPPAQIPADCTFLCDQMGIIYVGLAYRCKGNHGTFHLALQDLEASVKWFEERADDFNADMSRIGFSGGSAGTTLSAVLAQRYSNCLVYVGREGMYNVMDLDSTLSHFPDSEARAAFGLISKEQKLKASPYFHIRKKPAMTLLLHGKDDWLCHYTQSVKYAEKIKRYGGKCKLTLYKGINHTCLNVAYPEVFKHSLMQIAHLFARGYALENIDFKAIEAEVDKRLSLLYPYENISGSKLMGSWENTRYGTFTFQQNGTGRFDQGNGKETKKISYRLNGSRFIVKVEGDENERVFYLRKNDHTVYELVTGNNRWKSRRNDYRKIQ